MRSPLPGICDQPTLPREDVVQNVPLSHRIGDQDVVRVACGCDIAVVDGEACMPRRPSHRRASGGSQRTAITSDELEIERVICKRG
jgi:hypothetical protein